MSSVARIAAGVHAGTVPARDVVEAAIKAIDRLDPDLLAWVFVDREGARAAARTIDGQGAQQSRFPLAGVPIGVKDIFDVAGMVTTAGAAPFAHRVPRYNGDVVGQLRSAGAIVLGKTATTEFAYLDPAPTRNPWNTAHTPGGSSSGSAAAVAAGIVPVALGTQTVGSVLRPAAFCGIVGFKPGHDVLSTEGVVPLAWSFDHVGLFARSVDDIRTVFEVLDVPRTFETGERTRLAVPWSFFAERMAPSAKARFESTVKRIEASVADIEEVEISPVDEWLAHGRVVLAAEAAAYHLEQFAEHEEEYGPHIRSLVASGRLVPATDYVKALRALAAMRDDLSEIYYRCDALLLPTAPGPPPAGLESTGDASFCAPASFMGAPSISLPAGLDDDGLPLGIQLVGERRADWDLLQVAADVEAALGFSATAPHFAG